MIFRAQSITKAATAASFLLVSLTPTLADHILARQSPSPCIPDSLLGKVGPGNGGRKIGIVIDASDSMATNDPNNLRLTASKDLDDVLISKSEATNGKTADLVTVVDFAATAKLLYPLDDPAGAKASLNKVTLTLGTAIGAGIKAATDELTKPGNDPTANRTGIIVFTDGQDSPASGVKLTISEIERAAGLGIRVSFGLLAIDTFGEDRNILNAILNSGGIYSTIGRAGSLETFLALVLAHGLTGIDANGANSSTLIPSLATAAIYSQTGASIFSYTAKAGETFNITVIAIDPIDLTVTLRDVKANTDIKSSSTGKTGVAVLGYTAKSDIAVEAVVTAVNTSATGIFSIGLNSSISLDNNCNITTISSTSSSISPTPISQTSSSSVGSTTQSANGSPSTSSQTTRPSSGAISVLECSTNLFATFFSVFCLAAAALAL